MGRLKYKNKIIWYDNIRFQSIKEKNRYVELLILYKAGRIKDLKLQPRFLLQAGFKYLEKKIRAIYYYADFQYYDYDIGQVVVEDVKGFKKNPVYILKKKIFLNKYGDYYYFLES